MTRRSLGFLLGLVFTVWGAPLAPAYAQMPLPGAATSRIGNGTVDQWVDIVEFSRDGDLLALGTSMGVELYDPSTRELRWFLPCYVTALAISPDGTSVAAATRHGGIYLWNIQSGEGTRILESFMAYAVAFSSDGTTLVCAGSRADGSNIQLWDVAAGRHLGSLTSVGGAVNSVAFSPDGRLLAIASGSGTVAMWDVALRTELWTLATGGAVAWCVAFSPDGRSLASSSDQRTISLWDVATGRELRVLGDPETGLPAYGLAFSPDGSKLAAGSLQRITLWDVRSGKENGVLLGHTQDVLSVAYSPDGRLLASTSQDNSARLWDARTRTEIGLLGDHSVVVYGAQLAPDAECLATWLKGGTVELLDARTGAGLRTLVSQVGRGWTMSDDWTVSATVSWSGTILLQDVANAKDLLVLSASVGSITQVRLSPDGHWLACVGEDGRLQVLDTTTGQEAVAFSFAPDKFSALAFSPDGRSLVAATDDAFVVWDTRSWQEVSMLPGSDPGVSSIAVSPDGTLLAAGSLRGEGGVRIHSLIDGSSIRTWIADEDPSSGVYSKVVAFSPDGKLLACGSWQKIDIWDVESGTLLCTLRGHSHLVASITFSDNGRFLASHSYDCTALIWDLYKARP